MPKKLYGYILTYKKNHFIQFTYDFVAAPIVTGHALNTYILDFANSGATIQLFISVFAQLF